MTNVKQKIEGRKTIYAKGQYWDWNSAYKVYNYRKNYDQLKWSDLGIRSSPKKRRPPDNHHHESKKSDCRYTSRNFTECAYCGRRWLG